MSELKPRLLGQTMNEYGCDTKMENRSFPTPKNSWRMFIYPKWHKRWLAIAEKFKGAK